MINISSSDWMKILPADSSRFSLNELQAFKSFHEMLTEKIEGPEELIYFFRCFRFFQFFSLTLVFENKYPALTKCWKDLEEKFILDPIFEDGIFIPSWIFFNFPIDMEKKTCLDEYESFLNEKETGHEFKLFFDEMRKSRLGLYEEILSTSKVTKFRELITGNVISTVRSVPDYSNGEIFLARIFECQGEYFLFGDPKCWPNEYKNEIEEMVMNKLPYFNADNDQSCYEKFMRLSGPYWFSCVTTNKNSDILDPDHYLSYF
jgi:hypothetical protein